MINFIPVPEGFFPRGSAAESATKGSNASSNHNRNRGRSMTALNLEDKPKVAFGSSVVNQDKTLAIIAE